MLVTFVKVTSCENPRCREFAKVVAGIPGSRSYYCPVCGDVSVPRTINQDLASSPERYEQYLRRELEQTREAGHI
jgi:hypothetical protein